MVERNGVTLTPPGGVCGPNRPSPEGRGAPCHCLKVRMRRSAVRSRDDTWSGWCSANNASGCAMCCGPYPAPSTSGLVITQKLFHLKSLGVVGGRGRLGRKDVVHD